MAELKTSVVVNLSGNMASNSKKFERSLGNFSKRGRQHLSRLGKTAAATGRMLSRVGNRYTALLSGAAVAVTGKMVVGLQRRFTRLGIQANKSADEMNRLKKEIFDTANAPDIRVNPAEIIAAIEAIVEKTGDLEFARRNIHNIGVAIQATGATGSAIGEIMSEFQKMGIVLEKDVLTALDTLNVQGKEGAFTLENLAKLGPRVVTAYTAMGRTGLPALREMGAALQVIRQGTGSAEMAASAFEATLRTLGDDKKVKMLQAGGIQVFDVEALKRGEEILRPINEIMVEIIKKTGGKTTTLSKVFDAEALRAFNAASSEYQRTGAIDSMDKFMNVTADGTATLNDSARAAKDAAGSMRMLSNAWQQFADQSLSGPIEDLAGFLNKVGSEKTGKIIKGLAIGGTVIGGGLLAGNAAKGIAGLVGIGKAVTPVFVTNMSKGMGGKGRQTISEALGVRQKGSMMERVFSNFKSATKAKSLTAIGGLGAGAIGTATAAVGAAGVAGYGVGTVINKTLIEGTGFQDSLGSSIAKALALFGNDNAQKALASQERYRAEQVASQSKLEIEVTDKRIAVKSITSQNLDIEVDTGLTMGAN